MKLLFDFLCSNVTKWRYTNRDRRVTLPPITLNTPPHDCSFILHTFYDSLWSTFFKGLRLCRGNREQTWIQNMFHVFFNVWIAWILSFKSAGLNMAVSHHPAAIQLFKKSSYWESLFLCIAHFEMKRILMNTRLKSCANHVRFFQHAVINSDSNFNIIIWELLN